MSKLNFYKTIDLVLELESRGYRVIECKTLADLHKVEKLKEKLEL